MIFKKHCQKHNGPKGWVQWDITFLNILLWEKISKSSVRKNILKNIPYFWYKRTPLNMKYFRALCWVRRSHWAPLFNWERTVPGSKRVAKNFQIFPNLVVCSLTFCKGFYSLWSLFWYSVSMEQQGKEKILPIFSKI